MAISNIAEKVGVITGASSGIGESTARLLAAKGAKLVFGARRKDRIDAIVKDIRKVGGNALGLKTDVTSAARSKSWSKAHCESTIGSMSS